MDVLIGVQDKYDQNQSGFAAPWHLEVSRHEAGRKEA